MTNARTQLDLLILNELVKPIDTALTVLRETKQEIDSHQLRPVSLAALYAFAVSQLEIAIADTLLYIFKRNPWKMRLDKRIEVTREKMLSAELVRELLEVYAEKRVKKWSYGQVGVLFRRFIEHADLPKDLAIRHNEVVGDLRRRRNEILHQTPGQTDLTGKSNVVWPPDLKSNLWPSRH